ncbi:MAG: AbrB/MazE/SpoVT family DNA-binding domain-containing protein [Clostridia bacterium]|nr:AbrB/MazE/SpoVT family DNA-binding domain-containing protein [Clostridia bacterium]
MTRAGIVRRIDDLGRIVIPKEIRRTLRIAEGTPLEIFTDREGEIILKKYSPIGEMTPFVKQYAESIAQVSGKTVLIADRDQFIATAGGHKELLEKPLSRELEDKMMQRESIMASRNDRDFVKISGSGGEEIEELIMNPIISQGDVIGAVMIASHDNKKRMGDVELALTLAAAGFLGRQME